jgi:DNA polymerase-1
MPTLLPAIGEPDACYLVDLAGWARAAWEVSPPARSDAGERVEVVRAVTGKLVRLLYDQDPAYVGIAADTPGPVRQHALWPGYKAGRREPGPEYDAQIDRLVEVFAAHRIPVFRAAGYQAADLLAAATRRAREAGLRVVLVSRDHDLWQILDEAGEIIAWDGKSPEAVGAAEVRAHHEGVGPPGLCDLFALAGQDGAAPGVPGVGVKTAARLLLRHGSLEEVLRKWSWNPGKLGPALRDGAAAARLGRELVTLAAGAPIAFDRDELRLGWDAADVDALRRLGAALGIPRMTHVEALPKGRGRGSR